MKQFSYVFVATAAVVLTSFNANAQEDSGFYASAVAGVGFLGSQDLNYRDNTTSSSASGDFEASIAAGGTFGYRLNERWRIESELMYRRNDLEQVTVDGIGTATEGDYASLSAGVSALYDFKPIASDKLSAYVGAGVVFVQEIDIDFEVDGVETSFETDDIGLQIQLGARYDVNDRVFIDVGARYLVLSDVAMEFSADTSRILEADYTPLTISAGLGWRF